MSIITIVLVDAFWSAIAAMGFAVLCNVTRFTLIFCMISGAVGHATRALMMHQFGWGIEAATLAGAIAIGFLSKGLAIRYKTPSMIYAICGSIPMVPGKFAYSAMIAALEMAGAGTAGANTEMLNAFLVNGIKTGLVLGAIAVGITMPLLIFQRRKPIV